MFTRFEQVTVVLTDEGDNNKASLLFRVRCIYHMCKGNLSERNVKQ